MSRAASHRSRRWPIDRGRVPGCAAGTLLELDAVRARCAAASIGVPGQRAQVGLPGSAGILALRLGFHAGPWTLSLDVPKR